MDMNNTQYADNTAPEYNVNPYLNNPIVKEKSERKYSVKEIIFAIVCYILAYLLCQAVPALANPLGAFIVVFLTYLSTFVFMIVIGKKPKLMPVLVAVSAVAINFTSS